MQACWCGIYKNKISLSIYQLLEYSAIALQFVYKISDLNSPPPDLPRQGGGVLASLPWREGWREGAQQFVLDSYYRLSGWKV